MIIGLTGGIGCGKSVAAELFRKQGYRVIDSDVVVADLLRDDVAVLSEVRDLFGPQVFASDGQIDKEALAAIIFSDKEALHRLEAILHPRVFQVLNKTIAEAPNERWCIEIPLLFEKGLEKYVDHSVCLQCSSELQLVRLAERGLSESQALRRMAAQLTLEEKMRRADFIISNSGSLSFLEQQLIYLNKYAMG